MKRSIIYSSLILGVGLFLNSCSKSTDINIEDKKSKVELELASVVYSLPGYEISKATLSINGTASSVLTTPFACRSFDYFKNDNNSLDYSLAIMLINTESEGERYKNIIAQGRIINSQINNGCNRIDFYQDGSDFKIKINNEDPIQE